MEWRGRGSSRLVLVDRRPAARWPGGPCSCRRLGVLLVDALVGVHQALSPRTRRLSVVAPVTAGFGVGDARRRHQATPPGNAPARAGRRRRLSVADADHSHGGRTEVSLSMTRTLHNTCARAWRPRSAIGTMAERPRAVAVVTLAVVTLAVVTVRAAACGGSWDRQGDMRPSCGACRSASPPRSVEVSSQGLGYRRAKRPSPRRLTRNMIVTAHYATSGPVDTFSL